MTIKNSYIYLTAFTCGAFVMALELLGPRLIAVYFGATIYSWTAMIGITLLGLAAGYWWGGKKADQHASIQRLALILLIASLFTGMIVLLRTPTLILTRDIGLRMGALASSTILFLPVFVALGMISPFCVRLTTNEANRIGRGAGRIFAISTLGSFSGTVASGFYLIPILGLRKMLWIIAALLAFLALAGFLIEVKGKKEKLLSNVGTGVSILLAILFCAKSTTAHQFPMKLGKNEILHMVDSPYGQIKVAKRWPLMMLIVENGGQAYYNLIAKRTQSVYQNDLRFLAMCRPQGKTLLNIGLGGGNVARIFHNTLDVTVDVVEIDPGVAFAAKKFFNVNDSIIRNLYIEDGRSYIARSKEMYDFIVLDAFIGGSHPWQLMTQEAFMQMKARLNPQGMLAISLPGARGGPLSNNFLSVVKTLSGVFDSIRVFAQSPYSKETLHLIFASDGPLRRVKEPEEVTDDGLALHYLNYLINRDDVTDSLDYSDKAILTDEQTAMSLWEWAAVEWWRKDMVKSDWGEMYLAW